MKRTALLAFVAVIVGCGIYLARLGPTSQPASPGQSSASKPFTPPLPATPATPRAEPFASFPLDQSRSLDFDLGVDTRERLTRREVEDQLRDWALFGVTTDAGLTPDELNRALFDVPPVRHGYMRPVANFEYGSTRSCSIGDGRVVVLAPPASANERWDHLAHIADEHRKNLGEVPKSLLVFEYTIDAENLTGAITRRAAVGGNQLYTPEAGYHEAHLQNAADLERFFAKALDITYAVLDGGALKVGGRRPLSRSYRGIRVEEVAALWQAEGKLRQRMAEAEARWKREAAVLTIRWEGIEAEFNDRRRRGQPGINAALEADIRRAGIGAEPAIGGLEDISGIVPGADPDVQNLLRMFPELKNAQPRGGLGGIGDEVSRLKRLAEHEAKDLHQRQEREAKKLGLVSHTGFSLDPTYDFEAVTQWFEETFKKIPDSSKAPIRAALRERDEGPLLQLFAQMNRSAGGDGAQMAKKLIGSLEQFSFQAARYDGDLQGTEVGMILYYTDLLAKLWAIDFAGGSPRHIPDFLSMTRSPISVVYKEELQKLSGTRLWFGPEDRGYQIGNGGREFFLAPFATRIFAKSHETSTPKDEVPVNAQSEAFLGWWNEHYEEVARYEPEYERLNEVMKWSLVIAWLHEQHASDLLAFLGTQAVDRSAWFSTWVAKKPELTFRQWDKIDFKPRGYKGTTTEALPRLVSSGYTLFGEEPAGLLGALLGMAGEHQLAGGVSLGGKEVLAGRAALPRVVPEAGRISLRGIDVKTLQGSSFVTWRGVKHELTRTGTGEAGMKLTPKDTAKLRTPHGDLANVPFQRTVTREAGGLRVSSRAGDAGLGELRINATRNGFAINHQPRALDRGMGIGRRLSSVKAEERAAALAREPGIDKVVRLANGDLLVAESGGGWLRFSAETKPALTIGEGFQGRVADTARGAEPIKVACLGDKVPAAEMGKAEYLWLDPGTTADQRLVIEATARGPPAGAGADRPVELAGGDVTLRGVTDGAGRVVLRTPDLPAHLRDNPTGLFELFGARETAGLRAKLAQPGAKVEAALRRPASAEERAIVRALGDGRMHEAAQGIARNPEAGAHALNAHRAEMAAQAERMMATGQPQEAAALLERTRALHGPTPRLEALRGEALLRAGRTAEAQKVLGTAPNLSSKSLHRVGNEINRRLRGSNQLPTEATALMGLAKGLKRDIGVGKVSLEATEGGKAVRVEATLDKAPGISPAQVEDLGQGKPALLYVEDSPGLHNVDWRQPTVETVKALVAGQAADLVRLHGVGKVARAVPHRLTVASSAQQGTHYTWRGASTGGRIWVSAAAAGVYVGVGASILGFSGGNQDDDEDDADDLPAPAVDVYPAVFLLKVRSKP